MGTVSQPAGMYRPTWLRLRKILRALARYEPNPYPGVRRLADDTGIPFRTVARLLERAVELGLVAREPRPVEGSRRDSFSYSFPVPSSVPYSGEVGTEESLRDSSSKSPSGTRRRSGPAARKKNRYPGACCVCGFQVQKGDGFLHGKEPVHQLCDDGVPMDRKWQQQQREDWDGAPSYGEGEVEAPTATVKVDTAGSLARHFETIWFTEALKAFPAWKENRCHVVGATVGYIRSQFLDKGYSPEHVEAYIDAFYDELLDPLQGLEIKPGQTAWQLFTGWWGRTPVPDPAIEAERLREREIIERVVAQKRAAEAAGKAPRPVSKRQRPA